MTDQPQTIEQLLRDNGWVQDESTNLRDGEIGFSLETFEQITGDGGKWGFALPVLRAPRPEPVYEPGTVVQGRVIPFKKTALLIRSRTNTEWVWGDATYLAESGRAGHYRKEDVEIVRVVCGPDGGAVGSAESEDDLPESVDESGFTVETLKANPWIAVRDVHGDFHRYNPVREQAEFFSFRDNRWLAPDGGYPFNRYLARPGARWATYDELEKEDAADKADYVHAVRSVDDLKAFPYRVVEDFDLNFWRYNSEFDVVEFSEDGVANWGYYHSNDHAQSHRVADKMFGYPNQWATADRLGLTN